jgi:hypothetical protein
MKTSNIRSPHRPLLPLAHYQRIFRVIHSVLESVDANIPAASFFFSVTAAQILKKYYKMNAYPVAGAAFYLVSKEGDGALSFGVIDEGKVDSNSDAFHCWVQCEGVVLDFMAPIFQELLAAAGHPMRLPRQMFQKDVARMCASTEALQQQGDFSLAPNLALTRELLQQFMGKAALSNLSQVCVDWYRKPPKELDSDLLMQGAEGPGTSIKLSRLQVTGVW